MNQLDSFEKHIRDLFETSTSFLTGADDAAIFVHNLCESLQSFFANTPAESRSSNPVFLITLNPLTFKRWKSKPDWENNLIEILTSTAAEFGMQFSSPPQYKITEKNSVSLDEVIISVSVPDSLTQETGAIPLQKDEEVQIPSDKTVANSFLILKGDKIVPLTRSVINIGRRSGNQIIINDLRISRTHAQIRRIQGKYVVFDVGSTGGTYINSVRINQHTLRPGDVISLAGYTMIYSENQDIQGDESKEKTSEIKAQSQEEHI